MEGLDECIYIEIEKQLIGAVETFRLLIKLLRALLKEMDRLIAIADSYGKSAIYCTFEFAATMVPERMGF